MASRMLPGANEECAERMENLPSLRLFYALWPDTVTRTALQHLQDTLPLTGRRVPPENLHVTLAFLGERPQTQLPILENLLQNLPCPAMQLEMNRLGYFKKSRIAWVGMQTVPEALTGLHGELLRALHQGGIDYAAPEKFVPHVTLARSANPLPDMAFEPICWEVMQPVLVRSILVPGGSRYEVIASRSERE